MLKIIAIVLFTLVLVVDFMVTIVEKKIQPIDVIIRSSMIIIWANIVNQ